MRKDIANYGTSREKGRYRNFTWEPYETDTQLYLSIGKMYRISISVYLNLLAKLERVIANQKNT